MVYSNEQEDYSGCTYEVYEQPFVLYSWDCMDEVVGSSLRMYICTMACEQRFKVLGQRISRTTKLDARNPLLS